MQSDLNDKFDKLIADAEKTWSKGVMPARHRTTYVDEFNGKCAACLLAAAVIQGCYDGDFSKCPSSIDAVIAKAKEHYGLSTTSCVSIMDRFDGEASGNLLDGPLDKVTELTNKLFPKKTT